MCLLLLAPRTFLCAKFKCNEKDVKEGAPDEWAGSVSLADTALGDKVDVSKNIHSLFVGGVITLLHEGVPEFFRLRSADYSFSVNVKAN